MSVTVARKENYSSVKLSASPDRSIFLSISIQRALRANEVDHYCTRVFVCVFAHVCVHKRGCVDFEPSDVV